MPLVLPKTWGHEKLTFVDLNAQFAAVAAKFTAGASGIVDADISTAAAIKATKFSLVPGERVAGVNMEDDAIGQRELKDDATAGSPLAAVTTNHIVDAAVTAQKIGPQAVIAGKVKSVVATKALSGVLQSNSVSGPHSIRFAGTTFAPALPTISNMIPLAWWLSRPGGLTLTTAEVGVDLEVDSTTGIITFATRIDIGPGANGGTVANQFSFDLGNGPVTLNFCYISIS